jgi:hypothetical protein
MSEEKPAYNLGGPTMTPDGNGLLPRRNGYRGMLPSTWLERTLRIEYTDASGNACSTSGVLADFYPAGPVFVVGGAKTLIGWDRICSLELREEA